MRVLCRLFGHRYRKFLVDPMPLYPDVWVTCCTRRHCAHLRVEVKRP